MNVRWTVMMQMERMIPEMGCVDCAAFLGLVEFGGEKGRKVQPEAERAGRRITVTVTGPYPSARTTERASENETARQNPKHKRDRAAQDTPAWTPQPRGGVLGGGGGLPRLLRH